MGGILEQTLKIEEGGLDRLAFLVTRRGTKLQQWGTRTSYASVRGEAPS